MRPAKDEEPLLPPKLMTAIRIIGPLAALIGLWVLLRKLSLPPFILTGIIPALALAAVIYVGGRYYKPYRVDKATKRCLAKGAQERASCRHYIAGAKLGGGCGRQREDRKCRYLVRDRAG